MEALRNQNGSVLITALIIIAVLLTLFLSAFSYGIARYSVFVRDQHLTQAQYLAESGLNRFVARLNAGDNSLLPNSENLLQYKIDGIGKCAVETRPFGAYQLLQSTASSGSQKSTRYALLGTIQSKFTDPAITIFNNQYPLVITGTTRIKGDILSGPIQLTTGQIEGRGAVYKDYFHGNHIIDNTVSPPYNSYSPIDDYVEYAYKILKSNAYAVSTSLQLTEQDNYFEDKSIVAIQGNLDLRNIKINRGNRPLTIFVNGWVEIAGKTKISGLVEILSDQFIRITDSASIIDGLVMAEDSILIDKDTYISAQVVARREISVMDNAQFSFPSLILVDHMSLEDRTKFGIQVSSHLPLEANIMYFSADTLSQRDNEIIIVDSTVTVFGTVYSSDYLSLQGDINGSVMANSFKFKIPPTTYVNWLKDVHIDTKARDFTPVLPLVNSDSMVYGIIPVRSAYE